MYLNYVHMYIYLSCVYIYIYFMIFMTLSSAVNQPGHLALPPHPTRALQEPGPLPARPSAGNHQVAANGVHGQPQAKWWKANRMWNRMWKVVWRCLKSWILWIKIYQNHTGAFSWKHEEAPRLACVLQVQKFLRFILNSKEQMFDIILTKKRIEDKREKMVYPQCDQMPACADKTEGTLMCTGTKQRKFPLHALSTKEDKIAKRMIFQASYPRRYRAVEKDRVLPIHTSDLGTESSSYLGVMVCGTENLVS